MAARELYNRILEYMSRFFPDPSKRPVTVLAVPGYGQVDGIPPGNILPDAAVRWTDEEELRKRDRQWAAEHPKRFLAATVAVGTVDQALLTIVQTAHAHLRSVCLDRSLLVIDEVHASDGYMGRLVAFLLKHHLSMAGHALLLSATLGSRARTLFLSSSGSTEPQPRITEACVMPYPSLTLANGQIAHASPKDTQKKTIHFEVLPCAEVPQEVIPRLFQALRAGSRVLVILNTVNRANTLLRAVQKDSRIHPDWLFACAGIICPHHGRFAPADRQCLDRAVTERLGPGTPHGPVLIIGTQTLEQSLNIDGDYLTTDHCPSDVLLQRVGRLQRHQRDRPPGFEIPRCLVMVPAKENLESMLTDAGDVSLWAKKLGCGSVYEDVRVLELTLQTIKSRPEITIPDDNRWLVEQATHPDALATLTTDRWRRHAQRLEGEQIMKELAAADAAVAYEQYFGEFGFNEAGGKVATRLGAGSLLLPLQRSVMSPFGVMLDHIVIPGHMKPGKPEDEVTVLEERSGEIHLRCGERCYLYSRYGLEEVCA